MLGVGRPLRAWLPIGAILVVAAAVRFVGLHWGLPHIWVRPDEEYMITIALKFGTGDLNPHFFWYPTFLGYLLFACYIALAGFWKVAGVISHPSDILTRFAEDPSAFYLIARTVSALAGTATVFCVYLLGRRVFNERVGLASAAILAVAFLPVRDSHYATVDTLMTFFAVASLLFTWKIYRGGDLKVYLQAGALVGMAAATKYPGAAASLAIFVAHLLRERPAGETTRRDSRLVLAGVACIATFLLASPSILIGFGEFLRDLGNVGKLQSGEFDEKIARGFIHHARFTLVRGLTWPIYAASLLGLVGLCVSSWKRFLVLFSFPIGYYCAVGASWIVASRYVLPTVPFLALSAGWGLVAAVEVVSQRMKLDQAGSRRLAAAALLVLCSLSIVEVGYLLKLMTGPDTRSEIVNWAVENVPDNASVGWLGAYHGRPPFPMTRESIERRLEMRQGTGNTGALTKKRIELAETGPRPRFDLIELPIDPDEWNEPLPEYLVVENYPMLDVRKLTKQIDRWVAQGDYTEVRRWTVTEPGAEIPVCEPQDGVYIPYGYLSGVRCSGPELVLYRRKPTDSAARLDLRPSRQFAVSKLE